MEKRSVPVLPMKFCELFSLGFDPFGSCALDLHDGSREGMIFAQREKNMDVVVPRVYGDNV